MADSTIDRIVRALPRSVQARWSRAESGDRDWCRVVMNERLAAFLQALGPERLEVVEVDGNEYESLPWKSYATVHVPTPEAPALDAAPCDVVICADALARVADPWRAVRMLFPVCRPGGRAAIGSPFLLPVDAATDDYWRFTADGLRRLCEDAGFVVDETGQWGSRAAVAGNLRRRAPMRPWRSLRNESEFPLVVWAFVHRPLT